MSNLLDRLEGRKVPQKDVRICLDPNLLDERDRAMAKIVRPKRTVNDERMVSPLAVDNTDALARVAEVESRIADASITLRIKGVDRFTYNQAMNQAPPRKGQAERFDPTKFFILVAKAGSVYVDEAGAEHPISADEWAELDKVLTDGEHDRIAEAVLHVNRAVGAVDVAPFVNASETTTDSSETSASRETSGSHRVASGAGNRKNSTSKR